MASTPWILLGMAGVVGACTDGGALEQAGISTGELTQEQQLILGFERPTTDWSAPNGQLGSSTTVTQGTKSLSV
ncbi:MAG TPA: hypothetical protein VGK73_06120, partial [Polyangiaceae bacterium]